MPGRRGEQIEEQAVEGESAAKEFGEAILEAILARREHQIGESRDLLGVRKYIAFRYNRFRPMGQHQPRNDLRLDDGGEIFLEAQLTADIDLFRPDMHVKEFAEIPAGYLVVQAITELPHIIHWSLPNVSDGVTIDSILRVEFRILYVARLTAIGDRGNCRT
ncbi:hypothetical protein [Methylobacterium sp. J-078]|uniref:hypothetical protein n=1 Tax=Methylobacterium sp. J-078 TaxID=2836657 RepID=UPI001FBADAB4|nr:hypothetical protein [Methylobacterium sp. J-078]